MFLLRYVFQHLALWDAQESGHSHQELPEKSHAAHDDSTIKVLKHSFMPASLSINLD
jgi:hypothetical protein